MTVFALKVELLNAVQYPPMYSRPEHLQIVDLLRAVMTLISKCSN